MTIALIDDAINLSALWHPERVECLAVENGFITQGQPAAKITHATRCVQILEAMKVNCPILHIRIIQAGATAAKIEDLVLALQYCLVAGADIICLSVGSTRLSDEGLLAPIVKLLHRAGCLLFAALSNNGCVTLPASLPQAIGVISDEAGQMRPGRLGTLPPNPWGADIAANHHTAALHAIGPLCGNSFAVPFAVGMAYRALALKKQNPRSAYTDWTGKLTSLPPNTLYRIPARQASAQSAPPLNIALHLSRRLKTEEMQRLAAHLCRQHGIESAFVCGLHSKDSRIFHWDDVPLCAVTTDTTRLCADVDIVFFDLPTLEYYAALRGLPINGALTIQRRQFLLTTPYKTVCRASSHSMWDAAAQAVAALFEGESDVLCIPGLIHHAG